jgi:hypothetical protein
MMISDFADLVSRLQFPQKAAENLAKYGPASLLPPEADHRKKITPEQALREAMFDTDGHKLAELLTGQESPRNSEVWRAATNQPLPYPYLREVFGIGWRQYWTGRLLAALIRPVMSCLRLR